MPTMKKSYRRSNYRRKRYYRKKAGKKSLRKLAHKLQNYVHEKKLKGGDLGHNFFSSVFGTFNVFNSCLTSIPQGSSDTSRDGDRLSLRSIELGINIYALGGYGAGSVDNGLRIVCYQWFPATIPVPNSDVLFTSIPNISDSRTLVSPYSHDNRQLFRVLWDKIFPISLSGNTCYILRKHIINIPHRECQYNSGGNTGTNQVYLTVCSAYNDANLAFDMIYKTNFNDI